MPDDATARAARGTLSLAPQNSAPYLGWPSWFVQDQTFAKRNTDRNRSMLTRPLTQRGGAMSSASTAAASAPPSGLMKRALAVIRGMIDRVFGYDFFISYSWEDEKLGPYAVPLAHALSASDDAAVIRMPSGILLIDGHSKARKPSRSAQSSAWVEQHRTLIPLPPPGRPSRLPYGGGTGSGISHPVASATADGTVSSGARFESPPDRGSSALRALGFDPWSRKILCAQVGQCR
jgi:hypothetical protein